MAKSIAELNIAIGASIKGLQDGLKAAERELRSSGQRLSRVGTEISTGLSIPLGLAGVGAIKAAGDIESLTLALKSQLGSTEAARKEFELLTEAAKNPGIGLEQAVRASVRLQGVKLSASEARDILLQVGNAIASTGGTAQELDAVTRQFAQMISKGRVLQEDVTILSENMPAISGLMEKAFGTTSVENIRKMGVSGKDFVLAISKAAEELPRVEGGIKNSIGNAMDSLKQSAAKVGFAINEAFDVTGAVEKFSNFIVSIADAFANLSPEAQKTVLAIAGFAVAIGPVLKIAGAVQLLRGQMVSAASSVLGGVKSIIGGFFNMAGAAGQVEAAMFRVKAAFGIVSIVVALGAAVYALSNHFDAAAYASEQYSEAQKAIIADTSKEIGTVNRLFDAIKDETKGKFEKGKSIDQLLKLYPEYFKGMDLEGASVAKLTELQNGLNSSILRGVAERKKAEAVNNLYEKQAEILTRITQIRDGDKVTASEATLINTGDMIRAGSIAEAVIQKMQGQAGELTKQIATVEAQFDKTFGTIGKTFDPAIQKEYDLRDAAEAEREAHQQGLLVGEKVVEQREKLAKSTEKASEKTKELEKRTSALKDVFGDIENAVAKAKIFGDSEDEAKIEALRRGIERLIDAGFKPASAEVQNLKAQLDSLTAKPNDIAINIIRKDNGSIAPVSSQSQGGSLPSAPVAGAAAEKAAAEQAVLDREKLENDWAAAKISIAEGAEQAAFDIFSEQLDARTERQLAAIEAEGKARLESAKGNAVLEKKIQEDIDKKKAEVEKKAAQRRKAIALAEAAINTAVAITKAATAAPPPFNAPAIAQAIALGALQLAVIASQKFAAGTRDAPGGIALVGERGPELVNLPKHSQVFNAGVTATALRGGNNVSLSGEFTIRGQDLVWAYDRYKQKSGGFI